MKYLGVTVLIIALWAAGFPMVNGFAQSLASNTDPLSYQSQLQPAGRLFPLMYIIVGMVMAALPIGIGISRR